MRLCWQGCSWVPFCKRRKVSSTLERSQHPADMSVCVLVLVILIFLNAVKQLIISQAR